MSNPFSIQSANTYKPPITGVGAVGARGTQATGGAGVNAGGATPYQNDMNDFFASIANWGGAPVYQAGEKLLDFSA